MRILVIDDYRPHGESLAELLESRGHEASYARNYVEARRLLDIHRFDCAFLDFDMPEMTGPALAGRLSESFPALRAVIVSARAPESLGLAEGSPFAFLQKPVSLCALTSCLDQVQQGSSIVLRSLFPLAPYRGGPPGMSPPI